MRKFKNALSLAASLAVLVTAQARASDLQEFSRIEKGRHLTTLSDCQSCHTKVGSDKKFSGGRAIETPFGNIIAPNITPDVETGIGAWSDDQFDKAVRNGIGVHGEHFYPAMPYGSYAKMSRDDVVAIRAYLKSVPAVSNEVVANQLPFPFNIRLSMSVWNYLYFTPGEFKPDPNKSDEINRGAFLVDGPAHCGACHTPKTALGGDKTSSYLQGSILQGWFAPDLTGSPVRGLGKWSAADITTYLRSGHNRISAATGPMAEAVTLSTSKFEDRDLYAIAAYLKSLPGTETSAMAVAATDPVMKAGGSIYRDQCSACHGIDGKGVPQLFPDVAQSGIAHASDPTSAMRLVLRGARSASTASEPTAPGMPPYGRLLNDDQVAAVLTYMRNTWGNAAAPVAPADVQKLRAALATRTD
ncbi:MAG: hypothetical protein JWR80_1940 [Bradyrhizobium sp.]|nr:hypothetical protein [Bradyrhizobium sp.]